MRKCILSLVCSEPSNGLLFLECVPDPYPALQDQCDTVIAQTIQPSQTTRLTDPNRGHAGGLGAPWKFQAGSCRRAFEVTVGLPSVIFSLRTFSRLFLSVQVSAQTSPLRRASVPALAALSTVSLCPSPPSTPLGSASGHFIWRYYN